MRPPPPYPFTGADYVKFAKTGVERRHLANCTNAFSPNVEQAGLLLPLRGQKNPVPIPYLQLSSQRDAVFCAAQLFPLQRGSCKLINRTFQVLAVIRTNVDCVGRVPLCSFCSVQTNLHLFIQSLVDLISESLSSDSASHFSCPQRTSSSTVFTSLE